MSTKSYVAVMFLWTCAFAIANAGTVTYIYTDAQGTPLAETDVSGHVTATFDYRPYGVQALGSSVTGPGYAGHVNDPDIGLIYMQARYYDASIGAFISVDQVAPAPGDPFSFGRYVYAINNPVRFFDPNGRQSEEIQYTEVHLRSGEVLRVPAGAAGAVMAAGEVQGNYSDVVGAHMDNKAAANALDNVSTAGTAVAGASALAGQPEVVVVAGAVDEFSAVGAAFLDPTPERVVNVLTIGIFRAVKIAKHGEAIEKVLARAEQDKARGDLTDVIAEAAKKYHEEQEKKKERERNSPVARQSSPNPHEPDSTH